MPVANDRFGDRRLSRVIAFEQILLVAAAWFATRAYGGIQHDARIYIGRAVADIDPNGVGRDALFALDGQTHLSAYNYLSVPLVRYLGPSSAAAVLTYATLAIWLPAATWLASRMMPRRLLISALICAATLPAFYGPFQIFSFAEAFAVPRGLAEAGVLAALAALLSGRRLIACVLLLPALAFHAPTALVGAGVVFILLALEWPLLWLVFAGLCAAAAGAALLHVDPFSMLLQKYDPVWLAINRERNPFLFESMWPATAWSHAIVSGSTLAVAAVLGRGLTRQVLATSLAVGATGVLVAYVFGEWPSDTLILQLQTWRALWLVKLLAIIMIPFCAVSLWSEERMDSRLLAIFLACAWSVADYPEPAVTLSLAALALLAHSRISRDSVRPSLIWIAAFASLGLALISKSSDIMLEISLITATRAAHVPLNVEAFSPLIPTFAFLSAGIAVTFSVVPPTTNTATKVTVLVVLLAGILPLTLFSFDRRDSIRRIIDTGAGRDTLVRALGPTPDGIVWVGDGIAPIFWAGRPSWVNGMQGTASTFSRPLAIQWDRRSRLLLTNGLATQHERNLNLPPGDDLDPARVARGILNVCKSQDGPDAIVAPYDLTKYFPAGRAKIWRAPQQNVQQLEIQTQGYSFVPRDRYSILRCGDFHPHA